MLKIIAGLFVAFLVGAACRFFDIPAPAPPALTGALLVMSMSLGYITVDKFAKPQPPAATAPAKRE
jgi:XapX domain-containing protein